MRVLAVMVWAIFVILVILSLVACQTTGNGRAAFCDVAKPIYWSAGDTRMTKEEIDTHNRVGKALCAWGKHDQP